MKKPFRWTKERMLFRDALRAGITKDDIIKTLEPSLKDMRPSEAAMTDVYWSQTIDEVQARLDKELT